MTDTDDDEPLHQSPCQDIDGSGACFGCGRWMGDDPEPADKPTPLMQIVKDAAKRFDSRPIYRASIDVRKELDGSRINARRELESLLPEPSEPVKWKPSKAVIARSGKAGCILWATDGSLIEDILAEDYISADALSEIGLDDAPEGISVWEGVFKWIAGSWECPDDGYLDPRGDYRTPTDLEWRAIMAGRSPFEEIVEPPHGE